MDVTNMTFYGRALFLFLMLLCRAGLCFAQPAQLDFRQYDTDDGLPSSETYLIVEDRSGYIWIGTDNGVARFNGYEFEVFDADDGLEDMVVFGIVEDDKGRIWISTLSGKIYFFENGKFHSFEHSDVVEKIKKSKHVAVLIDVTADDDLIIRFMTAGFLKISSSGATEWLVDPKGRELHLYEPLDGRKPTNSSRPHGSFYRNTHQITDSMGVFLANENGTRPYCQLKNIEFQGLAYCFSGVFSTEEGNGRECIISTLKEVVILKGDETIKYNYPFLSNSYYYFMPGLYPDVYWAFLKSGGGLDILDFRSGDGTPKVSKQLSGHSLSSGILDRNKGFWVSTLDAGIFYCPYPKQLVYSKEDEGQNSRVLSVTLTGPGDFYAGYEDGTILHYGSNSTSLQQTQEDELVIRARILDMYYDSATSQVLSPFYSFTHPIEKGEKLKASNVKWFVNDLLQRFGFKYFNELIGENSRKIYASTITKLITIELDSGAMMRQNAYFPGLTETIHVYGKHPEGAQIAGTLAGLMELKKDGSLVPNNLGVPELSNRVVFIQDMGNDELLFGTRGTGVVYMGPDTTYVIRESDGLASDMVRDIHLSNEGIIWISTLNGLSRLNFSEGGQAYAIRTFGKEHGLPNIEIYQTDTYRDEIWLATGAGVVRFEEPPVVTGSPSPVVRSVVLNGEKLPDTSKYSFPPGAQNVSISYGTINYILGDEILYRYRLSVTSPWQYIRERAVNYPNLAAGHYRFEVQSKNQDEIWSESTILEISVGTLWYKTIWALIGGVLLFGALLSGFFLLRERRRKREQNLLLQITQLEHSALHAQMNPHFVFNALNSIQNFVLENDAKQAATYLSRFARVIRQTLRSSVDGHHHLNEELMMLETYLSLEKLRFKKGFSYTLEVDPLLPKDDIVLPPLLIQPFVENAILHGLKDRKHGGRISIYFTGTVENLIVMIEDNGKGYDPNESIKPDSLGMGITRRRLDLMDRDEDGVSGMEVLPLFSEAGIPVGTRVTLFIRPLTLPAPAAAP